MGLASFGIFSFVGCNRLLVWKLAHTGSIITGAGWAGRGWVVEALEVLEIEFGVGGESHIPALRSGTTKDENGLRPGVGFNQAAGDRRSAPVWRLGARW